MLSRQLVTVFLSQALIIVTVAEFDLVILHTNDFHDRVEQTSKYSSSCSSEDSTAGKCFGGISRIKSKVDELRAQNPNTILVDGGDMFHGTMWYYHFGGAMLANFMNLIGYEAFCLGNHEFDQGVAGLRPFVENASFPILAANLDLSETPELRGKIAKSTKIVVGGETIGIVGYTMTGTQYTSSPGTVKFTDELEAVQAEVDRLTSEGVNKIIALGHQGLEHDKNMAESLRGVDVIVGGHSHTFLYSGDAPSNEEAKGSYSVLVQTSTPGVSVLVVQSYAYGKYLGNLHLTFDDDGKVIEYHGNPVLLDASVPQDSEMEGIVQSMLPELQAMLSEEIGYSHVHLEGSAAVCRTRECNLGNLICDAMVKQNVRYADSVYWSDVGIAMIHAGRIRASIEKGPITIGDAIKVQPYKNTLDIVELRGETVLKVLEDGASRWKDGSNGLFHGFLQVSGMRIVYDMSQSAGSRVVDLQMLCLKCRIPEFKPLNRTEIYQIVMITYIADGGDGYRMIPEETIRRHTIGNVDLDVFVEHVQQQSPIVQGLDGRIRFVQDIKRDSLVQKLVSEQCAGSCGDH